MPAGLSIRNVISNSVVISPQAIPGRSFGTLLILGSTDAIDVGERMRRYSSMEGVGLDFSGTDPEFLAARDYFSQAPRPAEVIIGRWAETATKAILKGAILSTAQQNLALFNAVTNGALTVTVNGTLRTITGVNLSTATSLSQVASILSAATSSTFAAVWDSVRKRFFLRSGTTGTASTIAYPVTPESGTDLAQILRLTAANGAPPPVNGIAAETLLQAVQAMVNADADWYGIMVADASPTNTDHLQVAAYVEALDYVRIYGITTQDPQSLSAQSTADIGAQTAAAGYSRTTVHYSSSDPYAVASMFGRAFTVDFDANKTTITLMFKDEPGIVPEVITQEQQSVLKDKHINVFVRYQGGGAMIQYGTMASGMFFDERHGTDAFVNGLETDWFNLLRSQNKIAQTDEDAGKIIAVAEATCSRFVTNGFLAGGIWNGPDVGELRTSDALTAGYYVFAPPLAQQSQADREARQSVPIQIALKLAGAVHKIISITTINR